MTPRLQKTLIEPFATIRNQDELARNLELAIARDTSSFQSGSRHRQPFQRGQGEEEEEEDKENLLSWPSDQPQHRHSLTAGMPPRSYVAAQQPSQLVHSYPVLLMNKSQLVQALNVAFLGELKQNLVERLHEFTDCAYTKHEHRESIVSLLSCIKFQLHKLVKLIYRLVSFGVQISPSAQTRREKRTD